MFFSISHVAVVAIVVAIVVAAWKFERRKAPVSPARRPQKRSIRQHALKLAALAALVAGALTPEFGFDLHGYVHYIHLACTTGLAALAYMWLFPRGQ